MSNVTAGTTPWTLAEDYAEVTLANCATFQTLVGAGNATDAQDSIYIDDLPNPADSNRYTSTEYAALLPMALITHAQDEGFSIEVIGTGAAYLASGTIVIEIEAAKTDDEDAEAFRQFKDDIGNIAIDFISQADTPGRLVNPTLRGFDVMRATEPRERTAGLESVHKAILIVDWGVQAGGEGGGD